MQQEVHEVFTSHSPRGQVIGQPHPQMPTLGTRGRHLPLLSYRNGPFKRLFLRFQPILPCEDERGPFNALGLVLASHFTSSSGQRKAPTGRLTATTAARRIRTRHGDVPQLILKLLGLHGIEMVQRCDVHMPP